MTGLKVVFDRERSVLGWQEFNCKIDHAPLVASPDWIMKSTVLSGILTRRPPAGYKNARVADGPGGSPSPAPAPTATTLTPRQNDASNRFPGAAPLPRPPSAGSRHAAGARGGISLLLPLLLGAAALV